MNLSQRANELLTDKFDKFVKNIKISHQSKMDFQKICRLCLEESASSMWEIYGGNEKTDLLIDIFRQILHIEIHEDDQLPQQICEECVTAVTKLDETIRAYRENDEKLRKLLHQTGPARLVKDELMEMEAEYLLEPEMNELTEEQEVDQFEGLENPNELEISHVEITELKGDTSKAIKQERRKGRRKKKEGFPERPITGDIRCYICKSDPFCNAGALLAHLSEHSGELPHTCTICVHKTVVISNVSTLNTHKRMHANPFPCPHCDSRFSNKRSIDLHITMKHPELDPDKTPSTCSECGKVFLSAKVLRLHMSSSHEPPMACEVCGKVFKAKKQLTRHVNRVHGNADRVQCQICHKTLITLSALRTHMSVMHSNEQFKCKYCPRLYPSKTSLIYHEKQHELKPHYNETMSNHWKQYYTVEGGVKTCTLCGIVLEKAVRHHYTTKHFPEAKRKHRCDPCNVEFRRKTDLEVHMLEHTHGKFLKCPICSKEFAEKRYLLLHMRTKQHKDHPLAQSLDWIESDLPVPVPSRVAKTEELVAVEAIVQDRMMRFTEL